MPKVFENDSFNRRIIEKLAEYRDRLQHDEVAVWKQIYLDLSSESDHDCSDLRWQDISRYFKRSLVLKLSHRNYLNDQELIDRLQYPYLRKVYVVTIKFYEKYVTDQELGPSGNGGEIEDNKLFIKYALDGRYDPNVVAAFRRRCRKGMRIYVNINVADSVYNLTEDVKKLLLQLEKSGKERMHRTTVTNREQKQGSPILLDGVSVPIENDSPRAAEFSARELLDKESFSVNTQEYDDIVKESLERELSPILKKRRIDHCEVECNEVWLDSNEILSDTADKVIQEDPLNMSNRNGTERRSLTVFIDHNRSIPAGGHQRDISTNLSATLIKTEHSYYESETIEWGSNANENTNNCSMDPPVQLKLETTSKEDGFNKLEGDGNLSFIFPPDFISDASSNSNEESICSTYESPSLIDNENISEHLIVEHRSKDLGSNNSRDMSELIKIDNIKSEADHSQIEGPENDEFVFPPDFISDHSSDSEDEPTDSITVSSAREIVLNDERRHPISSARSQPVLLSVHQEKPKIRASQPARNQNNRSESTDKLVTISDRNIPFMNNSLETVSLHFIPRNGLILQHPLLMDGNHNELPSTNFPAVIERLTNNELEIPPADNSKVIAEDTNDNYVQPGNHPLSSTEDENLPKIQEIVEKPTESQPQQGNVDLPVAEETVSDSENVSSNRLTPLCSNPSTNIRSETSSPISFHLFYSTDSNIEMPQRSPSSTRCPTATEPAVQQIHATLQPTIVSRLRFQVVLRTCWPELFSKTGTFRDFYELMSTMAVNLFPNMRPVDYVRVLELGPMFCAIACRIAYGHCLQMGPQPSTEGTAASCRSPMDQKSKKPIVENLRAADLASPMPVIEISDGDCDSECLPVRKKRHYRIRPYPPTSERSVHEK